MLRLHGLDLLRIDIEDIVSTTIISFDGVGVNNNRDCDYTHSFLLQWRLMMRFRREAKFVGLIVLVMMRIRRAH